MAVKTGLYTLVSVVCFAGLNVRCESPSSSEERSVAAADSYELTAKSLHDGDDSALDATNADGGAAAADGRQLKRFVMPVTGLDMGHDTSSSRPYFTRHRQPQRQQQTYQSPGQQSRQYHQQQQQQHGRAPVNEHFDFGPPDGGGRGVGGGGGRGVGGGGGRGYNNDQSENYYQSDGENANFDQNGFTNFVPSVGFRSTVAPPSSSLPYAPSPQVHLSSTYSGGSPRQPSSFATPSPSPAPYSSLFDESGSGGHDAHSYDPSGYGHEPPPSGGYSNTGGGGGVSSTGYDYSPPAPQHHQAPIIHKSIYVHVAPPDDEPPRKQRVIVPYTAPKKNYQIVFIKAPTPPPPTVPIIPPPPQHSDKTLIYVLHPKHEEAPPIHVPPPPVQKPVKPEVYFIKYKHREEPSHGGGSGAGGDYGAGHGGQLPSPGEEFGGGDVHSGSYLHRRYGRNDKKSETPPPSTPTVTAADDGGGYSGGGGGGDGESSYNDSGGGAMAELRELTESVAATVPAATAADAFDRATEATASGDAFGQTAAAVDDAARRESVAVPQSGRDGSAEYYGDASVETPPPAEPEADRDDDASVESSVRRAHYVPPMSADVPKGKNGH